MGAVGGVKDGDGAIYIKVFSYEAWRLYYNVCVFSGEGREQRGMACCNDFAL